MKMVKKLFASLIISATLIVATGNSVYADETKEEVSSEVGTEGTTESNEDTEPLSDGMMIAVMGAGMFCLAIPVVIFSALNYRKYNLNEKRKDRDVF